MRYHDNKSVQMKGQTNGCTWRRHKQEVYVNLTINILILF